MCVGEGWNDALHHKEVLLILGMLSTDPTYYRYFVCICLNEYWVETRRREATQISQQAIVEKRGFYFIYTASVDRFRENIQLELLCNTQHVLGIDPVHVDA